MKYADLCGIKSSKIILGTDPYGTAVDEKNAFRLLDLYYERGGNHIDTARTYGAGESEKVVGKWLKSRMPSDVIIATKGAHPRPDSMEKARLSKNEIESDIDESLLSIGTDCIDLYWLHRDNKDYSVEEVIDTMNCMVKKGKIRLFGCSNWNTARIKAANDYAAKHEIYGFCASQLRFSPAATPQRYIGDTTLEEMNHEHYLYCRDNGISVMAFASQAKGFFSKYIAGGEDALSPKARERYLSSDNISKAWYIKELMKKYNTSAAAIVCSAFESISGLNAYPIIGGRTVEQISESLDSADISITQKECDTLFESVL